MTDEELVELMNECVCASDDPGETWLTFASRLGVSHTEADRMLSEARTRLSAKTANLTAILSDASVLAPHLTPRGVGLLLHKIQKLEAELAEETKQRNLNAVALAQAVIRADRAELDRSTQAGRQSKADSIMHAVLYEDGFIEGWRQALQHLIAGASLSTTIWGGTNAPGSSTKWTRSRFIANWARNCLATWETLSRAQRTGESTGRSPTPSAFLVEAAQWLRDAAGDEVERDLVEAIIEHLARSN